MRISTSRSFSGTEGSFGLPSEERVTNTRSFPSAWPWRREHSRNAWMLHWPLRHSCVKLLGRLAHSGSLQGASESSQRYCSTPHPFSWPQDERQEECAPPILANPVSGGSFGFHSDAGPFGSCPDIQFYSMSGPLQARPACLCRFMPQAARPHGSGLPCVALRVASHEAVPLVDKGAEVIPHCTGHSPYQGVARLLSTPFTIAGPRFSSERGKNRCD